MRRKEEKYWRRRRNVIGNCKRTRRFQPGGTNKQDEKRHKAQFGFRNPRLKELRLARLAGLLRCRRLFLRRHRRQSDGLLSGVSYARVVLLRLNGRQLAKVRI